MGLARFYDPDLHRFLGPDSHWNAYNKIYGDNSTSNILDIHAIQQSANLYAYAIGNPIRYTDPLGFAIVDLEVWFYEKLDYSMKKYKNTGGFLYWDDDDTNTLVAFMYSGVNDYYARFTPCPDTDVFIEDGIMYADSIHLWQIFGDVIDPPIPYSPISDSINQGIAIGSILSPTKVISVVKAISRIFAKPEIIGKPFDPKGKKVQIGVDPKSLKPTKDMETLDLRRVQDAVKYAGDNAIIVDKNGVIQQGHHRVFDAIRRGRAVDVQIGGS